MNEAFENLNKAWKEFIGELKKPFKKLMWWKEVIVEEKMMLKSRDLGDGKFEVNGVIFYADNHAEAIRKYRRGKKDGR